MRNCDKYTKDILCDGCDKLVNKANEFSANLNELKGNAPNEFGHILPCYETICMWKILLFDHLTTKCIFNEYKILHYLNLMI